MSLFYTLNPYTGETENEFAADEAQALQNKLSQAHQAWLSWRNSELQTRVDLLLRLADCLEAKAPTLADTMTREMGKLTSEALAEVQKCASVCRYYAREGVALVQSQALSADQDRAEVRYLPKGIVFAIMPWNFPLWQVFRFLAPSLLAGNTVLLKHAPNVAASAIAIEELMREANAPEHLMQNLFIDVDQVERVIGDSRIAGVTITGSERAGRAVGALAGKYLKPSVLELGGCDPLVVLDDADLEGAVNAAMISRFMNAGQTCIAAKRFIVDAQVYDEFRDRLVARIEALHYGDPTLAETNLAPMARADLRDGLQQQLQKSLAQGAVMTIPGGSIDGTYAGFAPCLLEQVTSDMEAGKEEMFGPVASLIKAENAQQAIAIANGPRFGLGASLWSQDRERAWALASELQTGAVFINGFVKSDPRWPFGGTKDSGYGRELWADGARSFCNAQTVWQAKG
ncbi:NAD-dependent succinate-semialdehyde dehydrogenase [Paraferrimonas sedimenticola]|uniref:Succinate dehydrogenase n=1 Tax=Paraferrimonas sedimenticola TaxID=375674 RepID=A0AA37RYM8_9GAMM|nr:NAD-dependent succinate-semialdehyde dehydrogenase [Paraferrimonas sedimenticola]GLP97791.1 succinate dehydrogenase [Paraferrimonas sedimenticola]